MYIRNRNETNECFVNKPKQMRNVIGINGAAYIQRLSLLPQKKTFSIKCRVTSSMPIRTMSFHV